MGKVRKEFVLPEWAFLDDQGPDGEMLAERTVLFHVRSASVIEIFDETTGINFYDSVLHVKFKYKGPFGIKENQIAALHYCMTFDVNADRESIIKKIIKPAIRWYCKYMEWEDSNMIVTDKAGLN